MLLRLSPSVEQVNENSDSMVQYRVYCSAFSSIVDWLMVGLGGRPLKTSTKKYSRTFRHRLPRISWFSTRFQVGYNQEED